LKEVYFFGLGDLDFEVVFNSFSTSLSIFSALTCLVFFLLEELSSSFTLFFVASFFDDFFSGFSTFSNDFLSSLGFALLFESVLSSFLSFSFFIFSLVFFFWIISNFSTLLFTFPVH